MFDRFNHLINIVMAILLTVSPHFMKNHGLTQDGMRLIMADAEKHAQKIIETGDAAELQQLTQAAAEMDQYQTQLAVLAPVMDKVAARLGISDNMAADLAAAQKM
jgi:hypothetical protein